MSDTSLDKKDIAFFAGALTELAEQARYRQLDLLDSIADLLRKSGRRKKAFEDIVAGELLIDADWICKRCGAYGEAADAVSRDDGHFCYDCGGEL